MNESENNLLMCEACNNQVREDDDFCLYCGTLFIDKIFCDDHKETLADGVCIICQIPFCIKCGVKTNNRFLCNQHSNYEIYEGTAKVYETVDETDVLYSKNCLEKNGLHPVLLFRHSLYGGSGFSYAVIKGTESEVIVMVPFQEVLKAEKVLKLIYGK